MNVFWCHKANVLQRKTHLNKHQFSFLSLPKPIALIHPISSDISRFLDRLKQVQIDKVSEDVYVLRYLQHLIDHAPYYLKIYSNVLNMGIEATSKKAEDIHVLDYGAGVGLMGIYAAFCGFRKVSINDISPSFLAAARELSGQLGISKIDFVEGALEKGYDEKIWGSPDLLVATDVIEHIYDLDVFLFCCRMMNEKMSMVFTTGSNPANRRKVSKLRKLQIRDEWEGNPADNADLLSGYEHEAYRSMRKKIISDHSPMLTEAELEKMVDRTRGLIRKDIVAGINRFVETGEWPPIPSDPFNTCHPETGSWSERILSFCDYEAVFKRHHFWVQFFPGFFDSDKIGLKKTINTIRNSFIPIFGKRAAPFIFMHSKHIHK